MHAHNSLLHEYSTSCLCTIERDVFPPVFCVWGFPSGSDGKASACNVGDPGLIPGLGTSLEEEMATHSSTFAWRIPWMEEPGGPQSMGSQRVGHD